MLNSKHFSIVLACMIALYGSSFAQNTSSSQAKVLGVEKSLDFTLYTFEIVTLRDKENTHSYKEFRVSTKPTDTFPSQALWKLNPSQAGELLSYLKKFEELRNTETSKTGATILTRIGRIENTDLFFQLLPTTAAYLKVVDRTSPEINIRISYNDLQALRRLLMEFLGATSE